MADVQNVQEGGPYAETGRPFQEGEIAEKLNNNLYNLLCDANYAEIFARRLGY